MGFSTNQGYPGLGKHKIDKTFTFSNTTGTQTIFTITGDVNVKILPIITTSLESVAGASINLGTTVAGAFLVDTVATELNSRKIWVDKTSYNETEEGGRIRNYFITGGNDISIVMTDQIDSGAILFYCFWTALSDDGNVVAA